MLYLYDIWVNWFDGVEMGYGICPYHEWRKSDQIEMLDQTPVYFVSTEFFHAIEYGLPKLPDDFLQATYKKTFVRKGYERTALTYSSVISTGTETLAIDTLGYHIPFRKSRLIPRQEQQVFDMSKKATRHNFEIEKQHQLVNDYTYWRIPQQYMIGLTRKERTLKQMLMICLHQLKATKSKEEICYWLTEWERTKNLQKLYAMNKSTLWKQLYKKFINGWSERHELILRQLVRSYPLLENYWEIEQSRQRNKENQNK